MDDSYIKSLIHLKHLVKQNEKVKSELQKYIEEHRQVFIDIENKLSQHLSDTSIGITNTVTNLGIDAYDVLSKLPSKTVQAGHPHTSVFVQSIASYLAQINDALLESIKKLGIDESEGVPAASSTLYVTIDPSDTEQEQNVLNQSYSILQDHK